MLSIGRAASWLSLLLQPASDSRKTAPADALLEDNDDNGDEEVPATGAAALEEVEADDALAVAVALLLVGDDDEDGEDLSGATGSWRCWSGPGAIFIATDDDGTAASAAALMSLSSASRRTRLLGCSSSYSLLVLFFEKDVDYHDDDALDVIRDSQGLVGEKSLLGDGILPVSISLSFTALPPLD